MASIDSFLTRLVSRRHWVQAAFLLVWLDPLALRLHGVCAPVFHCYACPLATFACPIGVLAQYAALHVVPFLALGVLITAGALFGGFLCGWACPFGFLQDVLARIPTPRFKLPYWLNYSRYAVLLALVLLVPLLYGVEHPLFICALCPAGAWEAVAPRLAQQLAAAQPVNWPNGLKIVLALLFLLAMIFTYRPWCRFCPLGAIFGLFNRFSALFLKLNLRACTSCQICAQSCDLALRPAHNPNDPNCIRCLECTICPQHALGPGTLLDRR